MKCPEQCYDDLSRRFYACDRPIKRNGKCGIHASADERRARNAAERQAREERERQRREDSKALASLLTERLGIEVISQFSNDDLVIRDDVAREFLGRPAQGGESRGE